ASPFIGTGLDLIFSLKLHYLIQKTRGQLLHALFSIDKIIICYVGYIHGSVSLPKFRRLGDTGPIIISHEEITCCYLVKSKSVLVTDISANFTAKMIRYQSEAPEQIHVDTVLGVDLGITDIAVTS